jgi:threonine dehydrogenase-like Zn-dependent dehydrogenase
MVFILPDHVHPEAGAMAEPLSIAWHAACLPGDLSGRTVAVLGSGSIGLSCALVARQRSARVVVCTDLGPDKAVLAAHAGADEYVDAAAGRAVNGVLAHLPGGADVTFVASGHPVVLEEACAVPPRGRRGRGQLLLRSADLRSESDGVRRADRASCSATRRSARSCPPRAPRPCSRRCTRT